MQKSHSLLVVKTFALASVGVVGALILHLPLPWMVGPLLLLSALSVAGVRLRFINSIRDPIFALVGIFLGSSVVYQSTLFQLNWLPTALLMVIFTLFSTLICALYFIHFAKFNREEAVLAAVPGALAFLAAYVVEKNLSTPRIILPQSVRVLLVVGLAPFMYRWITGNEPSEINRFLWVPFHSGWVIDLLIISALAAPLLYVLNRFSAPNAWLLGGMFASIICYSSGLTDAALPNWLLQILLILIGTLIGVRFSNTSFKELLHYGWHGIISTIIILILTTLVAWGGVIFLDQNLVTMFLAFAPGGVHEMAIIAFAYAVEPVFVTFHHLVRIFLVSFLIPIATLLFR